MRRVAWLAFALLPAGLAGCFGADDAETGGPGAPLLAGWKLDCSLGDNAANPEWREPCAAQVSDKPYSQIETPIAVDPTNPDNVVIGAKDMDPSLSLACVWTSYGITYDGGQSWAEWVPGGRYLDRGPSDPSFGYACNTDPMVGFGPDGTLYVLQELYGLGASPNSLASVGARIQMYASDDGGASWPRSAMLMAGDANVVQPDYQRLAVSPTTNTVFASFINAVPGRFCWIGSSEDRGASARTPVAIVVADSSGCNVIAASPDGVIVAGGRSGIGTITGPGTWFARSFDDGATFTSPAPGPEFASLQPFEENQFDASGWLEVAYDYSGGLHHGRLYLVLAQDAGGHGDVTIAWSDDDGVTWTDWTQVNQDVGHHDQWLPNIAVAPDGSLHVAWMDKRFDPDNRLIDIMHAVSLDGGQTWNETRITQVSFDGDLGRHQNSNDVLGPSPSLGEYIGIDAADGVVWVGFPTSHMGGPPVMAAARFAL